jgi:predicted transcriptional regulator
VVSGWGVSEMPRPHVIPGGPLTAQVYEALLVSVSPMTNRDIAAGLQVNAKSVGSAIYTLERAGLLFRAGAEPRLGRPRGAVLWAPTKSVVSAVISGP